MTLLASAPATSAEPPRKPRRETGLDMMNLLFVLLIVLGLGLSLVPAQCVRGFCRT
jgi:hypothetical protein